MSRPSMITWPEVGFSSRLMHRTSVDLPAPLMPTMPKMSPGLDGEAHILQGVKLTLAGGEGFGQVFEFDHRAVPPLFLSL